MFDHHPRFEFRQNALREIHRADQGEVSVDYRAFGFAWLIPLRDIVRPLVPALA